eukprot:3841613-Rhodomonas_salina.2
MSGTDVGDAAATRRGSNHHGRLSLRANQVSTSACLDTNAKNISLSTSQLRIFYLDANDN